MKIEFLETTWFNSKLQKKGSTIEASEKEFKQVLAEGLAVVVEFDKKSKKAKATRVEKSKVTRG